MITALMPHSAVSIVGRRSAVSARGYFMKGIAKEDRPRARRQPNYLPIRNYAVYFCLFPKHHFTGFIFKVNNRINNSYVQQNFGRS